MVFDIDEDGNEQKETDIETAAYALIVKDEEIVEDEEQSMEENPKYSKYNKMKKVGLPWNSIVNRMRMDGISNEDIAKFKNRLYFIVF